MHRDLKGLVLNALAAASVPKRARTSPVTTAAGDKFGTSTAGASASLGVSTNPDGSPGAENLSALSNISESLLPQKWTLDKEVPFWCSSGSRSSKQQILWHEEEKR